VNEQSKTWLWVGLGVAAGAGLGWWLANRQRAAEAAAGMPQLPRQSAVSPGNTATDGQLSGMGAPPQPLPLAVQPARSVADPNEYTAEPEWTQNEEF
jgi:hypothetical protein